MFGLFEENGDQENKIIVKNDQEPSTKFSMKAFVEERKIGQPRRNLPSTAVAVMALLEDQSRICRLGFVLCI